MKPLEEIRITRGDENHPDWFFVEIYAGGVLLYKDPVTMAPGESAAVIFHFSKGGCHVN